MLSWSWACIIWEQACYLDYWYKDLVIMSVRHSLTQDRQTQQDFLNCYLAGILQNNVFMRKQSVAWSVSVLKYNNTKAIEQYDTGIVEFKQGQKALIFLNNSAKNVPWLMAPEGSLHVHYPSNMVASPKYGTSHCLYILTPTGSDNIIEKEERKELWTRPCMP
jgi:hypothetical protein